MFFFFSRQTLTLRFALFSSTPRRVRVDNLNLYGERGGRRTCPLSCIREDDFKNEVKCLRVRESKMKL